MSEGKLSAQAIHAVCGLGEYLPNCNVVVLKVSDKKFDELTQEHPDCFIQRDKGLTEVEAGTATAAAWVVKE